MLFVSSAIFLVKHSENEESERFGGTKITRDEGCLGCCRANVELIELKMCNNVSLKVNNMHEYSISKY